MNDIFMKTKVNPVPHQGTINTVTSLINRRTISHKSLKQ
ncbi:MAG: hypothetical protein FD122_2885 [Stygiobacter sp.]|nr:MAG: hypothetical protein FD122_2885 [Stygiobacter sp.]KAF0213891.1 MAG: hypothetical protein FD178_2730 [Ignavibacteria bacterium]